MLNLLSVLFLVRKGPLGNGGIINGGVACVCAKWRVVVHFWRVFVLFGAFLCVLSCQNGLQKSAYLRITVQKCAKSAFKAKSGNLNLFLRILPFFPLFSLYFARKKGKMRRKRFRLPDFAFFMQYPL